MSICSVICITGAIVLPSQNFSINIDEFKSRLQLLCAKYDPDYEVMNVLNHDFSYSGAART